MIGKIGVRELVFIVGVLLLLFGARRIPELARSIGGSVRAFRTSLKDPNQEDESRLTTKTPRQA